MVNFLPYSRLFLSFLYLPLSSPPCLYFSLLPSVTKFNISIFAQALKPCGVASEQYHMRHVTITYATAVLQILFSAAE